MARGRKTAAASSRDLMAQRKNGAAGPQAAAPCPPPATSSPPAAEPRAYKQPADLLEYPVSPPNAGSGVQHRLPNMAPAQHHDQSMIPLAHLEPYPQHPHPPNPQAPTMSHLSSMVLPDPSGLPPGTHVQHPFSQHPQHPHHPHHPPSPPHMHTVAAGADHHHHQGHPPPAPESAAGNYTYANLTDGIVSHVFFPLVLKKIFEHLVQEELPANHSAAHFRILEERARELKSYGETYGLEVACEKYASVDLFMSAMVTSLSGLQQRVTSGSIDALLADTLAVASAAIQNLGAIPDGMRADAVGDPSLAPAPSRFGGVAAGSGVTKPSPGSRGMEDDLGAPRRKLKPHARRCLEEWFQNHLEAPYPTDAEKQALATQCQLEIQQVRTGRFFFYFLFLNKFQQYVEPQC
jgi:Homeobox KN domain